MSKDEKSLSFRGLSSFERGSGFWFVNCLIIIFVPWSVNLFKTKKEEHLQRNLLSIIYFRIFTLSFYLRIIDITSLTMSNKAQAPITAVNKLPIKPEPRLKPSTPKSYFPKLAPIIPTIMSIKKPCCESVFMIMLAIQPANAPKRILMIKSILLYLLRDIIRWYTKDFKMEL